MKHVAIYTRVSTDKQTDESQQGDLRRYLEENGLTNVKWYQDTASGADLSRPAFDRLREAVFRGRVSTVVVWKLDRLSRSMKDGINLLADWCEKGIRVISLTQSLDFSGTLGRMIAAVLLGVAEMERQYINERIRAGLAAARVKGTRLGRPKGSRTSPDKLKVKPEHAARLRAAGMGVAEIARTMRVSKTAVYAALRGA